MVAPQHNDGAVAEAETVDRRDHAPDLRAVSSERGVAGRSGGWSARSREPPVSTRTASHQADKYKYYSPVWRMLRHTRRISLHDPHLCATPTHLVVHVRHAGHVPSVHLARDVGGHRLPDGDVEVGEVSEGVVFAVDAHASHPRHRRHALVRYIDEKYEEWVLRWRHKAQRQRKAAQGSARQRKAAQGSARRYFSSDYQSASNQHVVPLARANAHQAECESGTGLSGTGRRTSAGRNTECAAVGRRRRTQRRQEG